MPLVRKPVDPAAAAAPAAPAPTPVVDTAALTGGDADARFAAARALAGTPGAVAALAAALPRERDARVREAMLTGLIRAGTPEAAAAMAALLRSDDASVRRQGLDALRATRPAGPALLPALLADPDPDVRVQACELARELPDGAADAALIPVLLSEPEAVVCGAAVDVLAEVGGPASMPALRACAARFAGDPFLAFAIAAVLQRLVGGEAGRHG